MAFMQCTAEQAEKFVQFLEASGAWKQSPAGSWEAYRLVKIKPTDQTDFHHSPLSIIVIHKNKKGLHSFDPLHEPAFLSALSSDITSMVREGLKGHVGQPADPAAIKETILKALADYPLPVPEGFEHLSTEVLPDGEVIIRYKFPIVSTAR